MAAVQGSKLRHTAAQVFGLAEEPVPAAAMILRSGRERTTCSDGHARRGWRALASGRSERVRAGTPDRQLILPVRGLVHRRAAIASPSQAPPGYRRPRAVARRPSFAGSRGPFAADRTPDQRPVATPPSICVLQLGSSAPRIWAFRWEVGDRDAPNSRIWSVAGHSVAGERLSVPQVGVREARTKLSEALTAIQEFAERHDELRSWSTWFAKAQELLQDPAPTAPYHADLLPLDAALDRRQLAAAVIQGWVFGGMGSWNDSGPADPAAQREYERVGSDLYSALLGALPAATNGA